MKLVILGLLLVEMAGCCGDENAAVVLSIGIVGCVRNKLLFGQTKQNKQQDGW